MRLTHEIIEAGCSGTGGYNARQLALFGVEWPPPKGWKARLVGTWVDNEIVDDFLTLKGKRKRKSKGLSSGQRDLFS